MWFTGEDMSISAAVDCSGGPFPAKVKFFKGSRELNKAPRYLMDPIKGKKTVEFGIKKLKSQDESKYTLILENKEGQATDVAIFSVFVKSK